MRKQQESLPPVHGLIDGFSLAWQMLNLRARIITAVEEIAPDVNLFPQARYLETIDLPKIAIDSVSGSFHPPLALSDSAPVSIKMELAPMLGSFWNHLQILDKTKRLRPVLWVQRKSLPNYDEPKYLTEDHAITLSSRHYLFPEQAGVFWCEGASIDHNRWWYWDIQRAQKLLMQLNKSRSRLQADEKKCVLVKPDSKRESFWQYRLAPHPAICTQAGIESQGWFAFPELAWIPFYPEGSTMQAFKMILQSYLQISLLDHVTDKLFYTGRLIATSRRQLGFPLAEKRGGRPPRDPEKVQAIGMMVDVDKIPKYRAAKKLGMRRSTLDGYVVEFRKQLK